MRPLSRLLSVFIALILMGTSLGVVSAHTGDPDAKKYALVTVEIDGDKGVDADNPANVNDELSFNVTVYRIGDHQTNTGTLNGPNDATYTADDPDDGAVDDLTDTVGFDEVALKYTIKAD